MAKVRLGLTVSLEHTLVIRKICSSEDTHLREVVCASNDEAKSLVGAAKVHHERIRRRYS